MIPIIILFIFTGKTNKYSAGAAAPPTSSPCTMKAMYKHVVRRLSPHWRIVCDYLEYGVVERNNFKRADDRSSLVAMLEDWTNTDNGRRPKTWSTFMEALSEIKGLSLITSEIRSSLESAGILTSMLLFILLLVCCYLHYC